MDQNRKLNLFVNEKAESQYYVADQDSAAEGFLRIRGVKRTKEEFWLFLPRYVDQTSRRLTEKQFLPIWANFIYCSAEEFADLGKFRPNRKKFVRNFWSET
jgi:hypothetical protein